MTRQIEILDGDSIGAIDAEYDDEYLFDCFVYLPNYSSIIDPLHSASFLYARTGAGKTAIIRNIERTNSITQVIDLSCISLDYITNSDVIRYLTNLGLDLDIFFQTLWKHVLCLEYIKVRFRATNPKKSRSIFQNLFKQFGKDKTKEAALTYLEKYADKFWIDTDKVIKEITQGLESEFKAHASVELDNFNADAGYMRKLSEERKIQLLSRFKKIVNSDTLAKLNHVMKLLKAYNADQLKEPVYILVDKIDEEWVEEPIKYKLIRALIEAQRSFGKIEDLKILVAIRADIFERVLQETFKPGTQREKFDDQLAKLTWSKKCLKEVVDLRISKLCKNRYVKAEVKFDDIFTHKVANKNPFDYLLSRTHHRPRDIISFVNACLSQAKGGHEVTKKHITDAERTFSSGREEALKNEWISALPSIETLLDIISARRYNFLVRDILENTDVELFILKANELFAAHKFDPIYKYVADNFSNWNEKSEAFLRRVIASELYKVGAISLKLNSGDRHLYSFKDRPIIKATQISDETKISVHPAFHIALNVYTG